MNKWHVEYNNDTGPNDDGFYQWWEVTDGEHVFKSDSEDDAKWLCELLNARAA